MFFSISNRKAIVLINNHLQDVSLLNNVTSNILLFNFISSFNTLLQSPCLFTRLFHSDTQFHHKYVSITLHFKQQSAKLQSTFPLPPGSLARKEKRKKFRTRPAATQDRPGRWPDEVVPLPQGAGDTPLYI